MCSGKGQRAKEVRVAETNVFWKGPESKYLGPAGQSVYATLLHSMRATTDNMQMEEHGVSQESLFIKTGRGWIWPQGFTELLGASMTGITD